MSHAVRRDRLPGVRYSVEDEESSGLKLRRTSGFASALRNHDLAGHEGKNAALRMKDAKRWDCIVAETTDVGFGARLVARGQRGIS